MRTHRYRYVHRRFARYVCAPVGREAIAQLLLPFPVLENGFATIPQVFGAQISDVGRVRADVADDRERIS